MHGAEVADRGASTVGELVKIGLSQDNRTRVLQAADHLCILRGNTISEQLTRCCGANTTSVDVVFYRDRDAVKGTSPLPPLLLGIQLTCGSQSLLGRDGDQGIQGRVVLFDASQERLCELEGGCGFRSQQIGRFLQRQAR